MVRDNSINCHFYGIHSSTKEWNAVFPLSSKYMFFFLQTYCFVETCPFPHDDTSWNFRSLILLYEHVNTVRIRNILQQYGFPSPLQLTVATISGLHKRRTLHLAHCTCIVTADGHHNLRTSQVAEFPPCSLYLYCHSWWSPRSPDFTKGRVSILQSVPVLSQLMVTTISGLHKRQSFHLAVCACTVTVDGHHDLRTSQVAEFPPCSLYLYCHSWWSPRSQDFTKGRVSTLHTVPVLSQLMVTTISGLLTGGVSTFHTIPAVVTFYSLFAAQQIRLNKGCKTCNTTVDPREEFCLVQAS